MKDVKKYLAIFAKLTTAASYIIIFNFSFPFSIGEGVKSALVQDPLAAVKENDVKKDDLIELSSDEDKKKAAAAAAAKKDEATAGSDSSDIQILSDVEEDADDPDNSGKIKETLKNT